MHIIIAFVISACLFASFHPIEKIPENEICIDTAPDYRETNYIQRDTKSLMEIRYRNVVKQNFDYSCGSAALATLLNYYLGENFTEYQVIQGLMEYGNKQKIAKRRAFSLLDMKRFVNKLGYRGAGYKAELSDLYQLEHPFIVPISKGEYRHFTVCIRVTNDRFFLADPFSGHTSYTKAKFKKIWFNNVIFLVYPDGAKTFDGLKLTDQDLRYIDEDSVLDILMDNRIDIPMQDEKEDYFTLPDEYQKYNPF